MPEYSELQQKFHMISGTHIAGKIFLEYAFFLKDMYSHKIKGETKKINRLVEAEAKVLRVVDLLSADLQSIGCDLKLAENEIDNLQQVLYAVLQLNEVNQKRVMGLMNKLKKEEEYVIANS